MECCERKNFSHNTLLKERPEIGSLFFNTIRGCRNGNKRASFKFNSEFGGSRSTGEPSPHSE